MASDILIPIFYNVTPTTAGLRAMVEGRGVNWLRAFFFWNTIVVVKKPVEDVDMLEG